MRTNRLHYLLPKLPFKSLLLALTASFFLSACGIKGDLYQTPEQAVVENEDTNDSQRKAVDENAKPTELKRNTLYDSTSEQPIVPPIDPEKEL